MTTPIKPDAGPPIPPEAPKGEQGKLQGTPGKVSQATGIPASQGIRQVSVPFPAATSSSPDIKGAVASIKQKEIGLEALLKMAPPVRDIILSDLSNNDLDAFEIALSKGTTLQETYTTAFEAVKKQITQIKQKRIEPLLNEILTDHPEWKSLVETWKNVSLEDKIWLLQLYELRNIGVNIPQIDAGHPSPTPDLLKPETKKAINEALSKVQKIEWVAKDLRKCPRAIGLLANLEELDLSSNPLTVPPDVSRNVNLKELHLYNCLLLVPPDVSRSINLEYLYFNSNNFTVAPDISRNIKLKYIQLNFNQLTAPPDVSQNVHLQELHLYSNPLTTQAKQELVELRRIRNNLKIEF